VCTTGTARSQDTPLPRATLREVFRIRLHARDSAAPLHRMSWIATTTRGIAFVGDMDAREIRVIDSAGHSGKTLRVSNDSLLNTLTSIDGAHVIGDSVIAVWSAGAARVAVMSLDGNTRVVFRVARRGYQARGLHLVAEGGNGSILLRTLVGAPPGKDYWIRYSQRGQLLDSIGIPGARSGWWTPDGTRFPFWTREVSAPASDGGFIVGTPATYAVERRRATDTIRMHRAFTPVDVKPNEAKEWNAWLAGDERATPGATLPSQKPAFRSVRTDPQQRLWVERYVAADSSPMGFALENRARQFVWREPTVFDVFDASFAPLFSLQLPALHQLLSVNGPRLWTLATDAVGESLVCLELLGTPRIPLERLEAVR
jgi:hypothetical protein